MTEKEFFRAVSNGKSDVLELLIEIFVGTKSTYCVIGGLAVNAYVEPVISLDVDVVVAVEHLEPVLQAAERKGFMIERFSHSVYLNCPDSDLRVQLQTDPMYQDFLPRAELRQVLGYELSVGKLEDLLVGKARACQDPARRPSKRQKDLADIMRIVESYPDLKSLVPPYLIPD